MKKFDMKSFIKNLNINEFVRACGIPMGYKAGYPLIDRKNGTVLLTVPYYKTKYGKMEQNGMKGMLPGLKGVMPAEYTVKFELCKSSDAPESMKDLVKDPEGCVTAKPAGFETLRYCDKFKNIPFGSIISTVPTPAMSKMGKEEFIEKTEKLFKAYDTVINDLLGIEKASGIDKVEFKQLLDLFTEPEVKEIYKLISEEFAAKYFPN